MIDTKDQLIEMQRLLGPAGYVDGIWAMRVNANPPVPKAFTRQWAWKREKVVNLRAYKRATDDFEKKGFFLG